MISAGGASANVAATGTPNASSAANLLDEFGSTAVISVTPIIPLCKNPPIIADPICPAPINVHRIPRGDVIVIGMVAATLNRQLLGPVQFSNQTQKTIAGSAGVSWRKRSMVPVTLTRQFF